MVCPPHNAEDNFMRLKTICLDQKGQSGSKLLFERDRTAPARAAVGRNMRVKQCLAARSIIDFILKASEFHRNIPCSNLASGKASQ
ncbi:hypothetical protein CU102_01945 [Phyllobacterium brassicacearum]|uniref:Uncharacterized protein n=1 Tax=Phyllobacterium brassicacearum TaxID=314235 RepID=A0A2P7BWK3_9HYPH|nr:hypothetical protein CU102_01945 [Phyllobacterium brassicacearum]